MRAIILLSGGADSAVMLKMALERGLECLAISFDYGQRHVIELSRAEKIAAFYNVEHKIIHIDKSAFAKSALVGDGQDTYVPARNTLFLSFALAQSEIWEAQEIHIGANRDDFAAYPDCRPEYFSAFGAVARLGTKTGAKIAAPLASLTKGEVLEIGKRLRVPLEITWSCYDPQPGPTACGKCGACRLRTGMLPSGDHTPIKTKLP